LPPDEWRPDVYDLMCWKMTNRSGLITTEDGDDVVAVCRPDLGGHAQ